MTYCLECFRSRDQSGAFSRVWPITLQLSALIFYKASVKVMPNKEGQANDALNLSLSYGGSDEA